MLKEDESRRRRLGKVSLAITGLAVVSALGSTALTPGVATASTGGSLVGSATVSLSHIPVGASADAVRPAIANTNCTFALFVQGSLYYAAIYNCNNPVKTNNLQGFASFPGGSSSTGIYSSGGAFTRNGVTTNEAGYSPGSSTLTLVADIDTGAGYQIQNVSCAQTGGHTFHCVTKSNA